MSTKELAHVAKNIDAQVQAVLKSDALVGFDRAYTLAEAVGTIETVLSPEYMAPIMKLQGTRLGFRTDRDSGGGYDTGVVKRCLIEAVLNGLQPVGNHFNIIGGNMYPTKEGLGYLLDNREDLYYEITPKLPRISGESAAVIMKIVWSHPALTGGELQEREIEFAIRVNKGQGPDAIIGKATRKARAWLWAHVSGREIGEGDVQDIPHVVVEETPKDPTPDEQVVEDHKSQYRRVVDHAAKCDTLDELELLEEQLEAGGLNLSSEEYKSLFKFHRGRINASNKAAH